MAWRLPELDLAILYASLSCYQHGMDGRCSSDDRTFAWYGAGLAAVLVGGVSGS
jgi:hypothetical protein